jgi:co-chaperonin GroES (HSP10)
MHINPLPGNCIIEVAALWRNEESGIFIPTISRRMKASHGKVVAVTPYPSGPCMVWKGRRRVTVHDGNTLNVQLPDLMGRNVLFETGRTIEGTGKSVVRLEHVIAVLPDTDGEISILSNDDNLPRCKWCKSDKGEGNMLLDGHGHCIQCGRNAAGDKRDPNDLGKVPVQLHEAMNPEKRQATGKVVSYGR